jgi:hypothetical protein
MDDTNGAILHIIISFLVDISSPTVCISKRLLERGDLENLHIRAQFLNFEDSSAPLLAKENLGAVSCFEQVNMSVVGVSCGR